jgi:hypothetical protein
MMDDDYPLAKSFYISHVVTGQQNSRPGSLVIFADELANTALHGHIQANGRFIKEQDLWSMQQ